MATVLVPLDETAFAETVLSDARVLAGRDGNLVLFFVVPRKRGKDAEVGTVEDAQLYLENEAQLLQSHGVQVSTKVLVDSDIPHAIDQGIAELGVEFVAVATYGMGRHERLGRSFVAWKALAHSSVPILFRHGKQGEVADLAEHPQAPIKIMVPLDGSPTAERALPLAASLAARWQATVVLVHVSGSGRDGNEYLEGIVKKMHGVPKIEIRQGSAADSLVQASSDLGVTHVVMTSHGRTGLSRVIAGDIAATLIERLSLPIIVVPAFAVLAGVGDQDSERDSFAQLADLAAPV